MSETKGTGVDRSAPTAATETAAAPPSSGAKSAARETVVVHRPMSRVAKAVAVAVTALVIGAVVFAVVNGVQSLSKNDSGVATAINQTMDPAVRYLKTALGAAIAKPAGQMVSSITAVDLTNPCRMLLKGVTTDFTKADLSCLKDPDTFKDITVTADQAARFCHGIAKVNPAVGMQCVSGMYREVFDKTTSQRRLQ